VLFSGCTKEIINDETTEIQTEKGLGLAGVSCKNGILCFSSNAEFKDFYDKNLNMSDSELDNWEKNTGFISMRNIFNQIVDAENALELPYENMTPEQLKNATPPPSHSELYFKYLKSGFLKLRTYEDGTESYDYNVINPSSVGFYNENGLLKIGDTIYQVTDKALKIITDGDFGKIDLLQKTDKSDRQNHIDVISFGGNDKGLICSRTSGWVSSGNAYHSKRIKTDITYYTNVDPGCQHAFITYNIGVECQRKNVWGNWKYYSTDTYISGNWTSSITLFKIIGFGKISISYPCSYTYASHPNQINNFHASINPFNGTTAPFPSSWVYHNPYPGYQFDRAVDVNILYNWTAHGFGLTATAKYPD
jgi:hypothetical protein